jgi:sulfur carrier protein ThiS
MPTLSPTRIARFSPLLVVAALALPSAAFGQATRTWVSGVGDDANPCSRTAPCKTFAGAISKTAAGGIIDAMDDGGFGALTITKAITVDGGHHTAGVLASGGINAINVAAGVNDKVVLKNLDIEGNGTTLGLNGIRITQASNVKIYNNDIGFFSRSGISLEPNASTVTKMVVKNNRIHDNGGNGVNVAPQNLANGKVGLRNNEIDDNTCGIVATTFGMTNVFGTNCGTADSSSGISGRATINAFENGLAENSSIGVLARGNKGTIRIGSNQITGSTTGLMAMDAGVTLLTFSNNMVTGNGTDGASTGNVGFLKRGY